MSDDNKFVPVTLTPLQAKMWSETRTALLWSQPAFSDIWYNLMLNRDGESAIFVGEGDKRCPVDAATNGKSLVIQPEKFFKKKLLERVFVGCHEILHCVYDDPAIMSELIRRGEIRYPDGKVLKVKQETLERAADMRIDAALVDAKVGELPEDATYDPALVSAEDTLIGAYRKLYEAEEEDKSKKGKQPGDGGGKGKGKGFDSHLKPGVGEGQTEEQAKSERNESEWQQGVAAAIASARAQGKLPGSLEALLGKVMRPNVDWKEHIRSFLMRNTGSQASSWNKLDPELMIRGIGAPGRVGFGAGLIVVVRDTSGSVSDDEIVRFGSEIGGVIDDVNPRTLLVLDCDARVNQAFECDDIEELQRKGVKGRGGTSFDPPFRWLEDEGLTPDTLIYFTDMECSFPISAPNYPVIWASIRKGYKTNPWGDYVDVPFRHTS